MDESTSSYKAGKGEESAPICHRVGKFSENIVKSKAKYTMLLITNSSFTWASTFLYTFSREKTRVIDKYSQAFVVYACIF